MSLVPNDKESHFQITFFLLLYSVVKSKVISMRMYCIPQKQLICLRKTATID